MLPWVKCAVYLLVFCIILELVILGPPLTNRISTSIYQYNLDLKVGDVLTNDGKLQHTGYLSFPTLHWNPQSLNSTLYKKLRYKQWDFYAMYTENITLCVALADIGYAKNAFITIYEKGRNPITYDQIIFPWEPTKMSENSEEGTTFYNSSSIFVLFVNAHKYLKSVIAHNSNTEINLQFRKSPQQESIVYLGPFNSDMSQFFYSHKVYNYKVYGYAEIEGREYVFNEELGMLDWVRGVWPYHGGWIWGSGMGEYEGNKFALNLGELPKDPNVAKATDDCVIINENMIKLDVVIMEKSEKDEDVWEFYTVNSKPQALYSAIKGEFRVEAKYNKNINFWAFQSYLLQNFGVFEGEVKTLEGDYKFKVRGILEVHNSRW